MDSKKQQIIRFKTFATLLYINNFPNRKSYKLNNRYKKSVSVYGLMSLCKIGKSNIEYYINAFNDLGKRIPTDEECEKAINVLNEYKKLFKDQVDAVNRCLELGITSFDFITIEKHQFKSNDNEPKLF